MKRMISILLLILILTAPAWTQEELSPEELLKRKMAIAARQFRPPDWIRGTWSDMIKAVTYEFHEDDVCLVYGTQRVSMTQMIPPDMVKIEHCSEDNYEFSIPGEGGRVHYIFSLTATGSLMLQMRSDTLIGPVILFKEE